MNTQAMPDPETSSQANPLPTSGEIIGFLVKTLEVTLDLDVKERTWRNYITGKPVSEKTREAIFDALTSALVGAAGDCTLPDGTVISRDEAVRGFRNVLMAQAEYWDDLRAQLPAGASPKAVPLLAIVALRLAIIDLSVRFAAILVQQKEVSPPQECSASDHDDSQPDVESNVLGRMLRELLKIAQITREDFAEALDVSKQAVDKWLDGRDLPPAQRLEELVDLMVRRTRTPNDVTPVRVMLRTLRLLTKAIRPLEACIGRAQLKQLGSVFLRLTRFLWLRLAQVEFETDMLRNQSIGELLLLGVRSGTVRSFLRAFARQEKDVVWRGLIRAATADWTHTLNVIQGAADRLATIEKLVDTEGFRHVNIEEQAEVALVTAFASEHLPDVLVHMYNVCPEQRMQMSYYMLGMRFQEIWKMSDGPEKALEFARLTEPCRMAATTSPWQPELFNQLAWMCHVERVRVLLQPFENPSNQHIATLARASREALAAMEEAPRKPPPAKMKKLLESLQKLCADSERLCAEME